MIRGRGIGGDDGVLWREVRICSRHDITFDIRHRKATWSSDWPDDLLCPSSHARSSLADVVLCRDCIVYILFVGGA